MVTQEEIRRIRLEYARKTGRIILDRALIKAAKAGVPPEKGAAVLRDYRLGRISMREAARRLEELAQQYEKPGRGGKRGG